MSKFWKMLLVALAFGTSGYAQTTVPTCPNKPAASLILLTDTVYRVEQNISSTASSNLCRGLADLIRISDTSIRYRPQWVPCGSGITWRIGNLYTTMDNAIHYASLPPSCSNSVSAAQSSVTLNKSTTTTGDTIIATIILRNVSGVKLPPNASISITQPSGVLGNALPRVMNADTTYTMKFAATLVGTTGLLFSANGVALVTKTVTFTLGVAPSTSNIVNASKSTLNFNKITAAGGDTIVMIATLRNISNAKVAPTATLSMIQLLSVGGTGVVGTVLPTTILADSTYRIKFYPTTAGNTNLQIVANNIPIAVQPITVTSTIGIPTPDITMSVNRSITFPISPFIYGGNSIDSSGKFGGSADSTYMTFNRYGGNRLTAYNWENNYSNAGADFNYQNDQFLSTSTTPGAAVNTFAAPSFARNQAFLATVPMIGYVAGDACNCNVGTDSAGQAARLAAHFKISRPTKGSAFTLTPSTADAYVNQDEFVNWLNVTYPGKMTSSTTPLMISLDNEPDIWNTSHQEIIRVPQTYTGFINTTIAYANAIKAVNPNAIIFGPVTATYTGISLLGRYPTPDPVYGTQNFANVYLDQLKAAEISGGRRLVDVFDVHFYPQNGTSSGTIDNDYALQDSAMIAARIQAPRSLWDSTYNDNSWVVSAAGGNVQLIPRLKAQIAAHYPNTKLAISEYFYGRGGDISGGIAQADVLGIFGREGVFAASVWPNGGMSASPYNNSSTATYAYLLSAFKLYRNYDGTGGRFGDTGYKAATSDATLSSIYASINPAGNVVLVVINKASTSKIASITLSSSTFTKAHVYRLTGASSAVDHPADINFTGTLFQYTMPALSVTTLELVP